MADFTPDQLEQIARAQAKITDEQQKQKQLTGDLVDEYDKIEGKLDNIASFINKQLKAEQASARQISEIKSVYNSLSKTNRELQYLNEKYYEGTLKTKDITAQLNTLGRTETLLRRQITLAQDKGNITLAKKLEFQLKLLKLEEKQAKELKEQNEYVDKRVGLTGKLLSGLEKIPILGDAIDFEEINTSMRSAVGNTNVFTAGLKKAGKQLKEGITDPLVLATIQIALFKKLYDLYGNINQRIVDQGKQLNISKEQSEAIYNRSLQYAASQRDAFVTGARITEGREKLNTALGTTIDFTDKEAITAERLSHYYGITEEQNAHIAMYARETGQTNLDILNTVLRTAANQKAQIGGSLSYQKILQKVSSVSGDILTRFKGNVSELTKAVQQADKLGLTLEQVDKIGESLLNFEQSIEAELKAELLTGKAINLEKARAAALSGDTVKLTNEIAKQVGNIHKFEKLNTIQRQAYAEAFGMTASEMGDMLRKRELEAKLGVDISKDAEKALKLADEKGIKIEDSIRKELEAKTLADLQKYTFEKIKTILEKIAAGPMRTIYNLLEKGLKFAESIFGVFGKMTGGGLGSALGTVLLAAPALILAIRGLIGFGRGLLLGPRGTDGNPMVVRMQGAIGGGIGMGAGSFVPGVGYVSNKSMAGKIAAMKAANPGMGSQAALAAIRQQQGAMGMRMMGAGLGLGVVGMGLNMAASGMEAGGARTAVGALGGAATGAGMGMMFGPWGAAIGGLVGGVYGLVTEMRATREKEAAEKAARAETEKRTQELLQQMAIKPIELNVNNETISKWNTYSTQNGANSSFP